MKLSRIGLLSLVYVYFTSCSINEREQNIIQENIDLALIKENEWGLSSAVLEAINTHRQNIGKSLILKDSSYATAYAVKHSKYMETTNSVNHNNFFIRSAALKEKGAEKVTENIAYGYTNAESVVNAWLKSEPHKETVEGDFTHVGFGIIKSSNNRYYYTALYYK